MGNVHPVAAPIAHPVAPPMPPLPQNSQRILATKPELAEALMARISEVYVRECPRIDPACMHCLSQRAEYLLVCNYLALCEGCKIDQIGANAMKCPVCHHLSGLHEILKVFLVNTQTDDNLQATLGQKPQINLSRVDNETRTVLQGGKRWLLQRLRHLTISQLQDVLRANGREFKSYWRLPRYADEVYDLVETVDLRPAANTKLPCFVCQVNPMSHILMACKHVGMCFDCKNALLLHVGPPPPAGSRDVRVVSCPVCRVDNFGHQITRIELQDPY
ncbi:uncharacterized protein LOC132192450 [Neocloeon triangulifer]|uniref:uncharacterized protein LOC132192450 n=1 Tax=Neocloeon triangulifer TaxID=2078957 RepID=UPI00286F4C14|nr:uncharacterized protein LOC132192450 [Neocloeon triangulifer]